MPRFHLPFQKLSNVCPSVWARSGRRNLILTRAVALGDPRGRKQSVSALSVFLIVFSVCGLVWARSGRRHLILTRAVALGDPRGRKQCVSARFRFSPLFVELCVCYYLGALSAPKLDSDAGGGVG